MAKNTPAPSEDLFDLDGLASTITDLAFSETDKVRRSGLLPGDIIAKLMKERPDFKATVRGYLDKLCEMVEAHYLTLLKPDSSSKPTVEND